MIILFINIKKIISFMFLLIYNKYATKYVFMKSIYKIMQ